MFGEFVFQELQNELEGKSGNFHYFKVDLCSEENILEAFEWVKNTFKSVDVLVNNAGVLKTTDLMGKYEHIHFRVLFLSSLTYYICIITNKHVY